MKEEDDEIVKSKYRDKTDFYVARQSGEKPRTKPVDVDGMERKGVTGFAPVERMAVLRRHLLESSAPSEIFEELPRRIPVRFRDIDVLVVGGGPAGLSAAIGSARAGCKTMLVERYGCFGGCITTVGMETLAWYRYEGTTDVSGVGIEFERRAARMGNSAKFAYNDSLCLDAAYFQLVADELVRENGIIPLLHTTVVDVILTEPRDAAASSSRTTILGIIAESKSGRFAIRAKRVVDCTGDADVAFLADCPYRKLPKEQMMGVTKVFNASRVDVPKFLAYTETRKATYRDWSRVWTQRTTGKENDLRSPYLDEEFLRAERMGVIPAMSETASIGGTWSAMHADSGEATNLNLVHFHRLDGTDVLDLTEGEMRGRKHAVAALEAMKATVPGFERAKVRNFSMTLGIRDTRKVVGKYELTERDVCAEARFPASSVGIFPEFVDGYNVLILPTSGRYFHVPFGCLVPREGPENLLVAGRCVAGDVISHAAMRNMMACCVTGQGAGVAAAVSVKRGELAGEVDLAEMQRELVKQGVRIH